MSVSAADIRLSSGAPYDRIAALMSITEITPPVMNGAPGRFSWWITSPDRLSAIPSTRAPASDAGAVPPAIGHGV